MSWRICFAALLPILGLILAAPARAAEGVPGEKIKFKKTVLEAKFRSEGVAVGDFNKDGKNDIAAGYVWYEAPDWKMHELEKKPDYNGASGYSNSFCTWAHDVNGDGWVDILVVDFPGNETWVFENPGKSADAWKKRAVCPVTNNESPQFLDVDGDGVKEIVAGVAPDKKEADGPKRQMALLHAEKSGPFKIQIIGAPGGGKGVDRYSHGLGVGDLNKDCVNDVLVREGWYEGKKGDGEWKFHPAPFGEACSDMHVYDFDADGDQDVLSCAAHGLGMWWHEQLPEGRWKTHEISKDFSQTHSVNFTDINGDGLPDFVTGKRFWAHGPKGDVNPDGPAILAWFELKRENGKPVWTKHQIDDDSGVGTQFQVADVNGDGLLDVAISNKKGVFYFEQQR